jgi:hypothetical protein
MPHVLFVALNPSWRESALFKACRSRGAVTIEAFMKTKTKPNGEHLIQEKLIISEEIKTRKMDPATII